VLFFLLSESAAAQLPLPPPDGQIREYFKQADAVARGRLSDVRASKTAGVCCSVSFVFHAGQFLKGADDSTFVFVFDPRGPGLNEEFLREYYDNEPFVFFYKKTRAGKKLTRDSIWIARPTSHLLELIDKIH
jgi:hypothetical protein